MCRFIVYYLKKTESRGLAVCCAPLLPKQGHVEVHAVKPVLSGDEDIACASPFPAFPEEAIRWW